MATKEEPAVIVRQAYKYYGSKKEVNKKIVLHHLNMTVDRGSIYGLLGSSGCGKTTLLSCVVGVRHLISGHIKVLGKEGRKETRSVAASIGYMPQEVALVGEFKVKDALYFFGRLYGLSESKIEERFDYLSKLLELPDASRYIKNLSGGQQRRVSFAAALVHEPELLILDEPTVGLDPILREKIWHHLVELSTTRNVAVIITTHYIEEAKQASRIGLMRGGELLAEDTPANVLRMFNCASLEEAFLILSIKQSKVDGSTEEPVIIETNETPVEDTPDPEIGEVKNHYDSKEDFSNMYCGSSEVLTNGITNNNNNGDPPKKHKLATKSQKYKALFTKNIQQFARHPGGLLFSVIFPIIQMMAFLLAVGHDIRVIHMGIVNEEVPILDDCYNASLVTAVYNPQEYTCSYNKLSCRYVDSLDDDIIIKHYYNTLEEGLNAVNTGKVIGTLHIAKNFSESLYLRVEEGSSEGDIENSFLNFYLDMSNHQMSYFVKKKLYDDYEIFSKDLLIDCKSSPKLGSIPVNFKDPIYGTKATSYTDFMAPGLMATCLFFLATTATSNLLIADKLEGVWDRTIVAGVESTEILTVHVIIHSLVILMQVLEVMLITFLGYRVPFRGDTSTVAILLVLQGFVGMAYGFFISITCQTYSLAFFVSTGSFYPLILLCGIVWPIEGMQTGLRIFSLFLPFTIPIRSLRNVIEKGYSIIEYRVLDGYIVSIVWITCLLSCCFLLLRFQRS